MLVLYLSPSPSRRGSFHSHLHGVSQTGADLCAWASARLQGSSQAWARSSAHSSRRRGPTCPSSVLWMLPFSLDAPVLCTGLPAGGKAQEKGERAGVTGGCCCAWQRFASCLPPVPAWTDEPSTRAFSRTSTAVAQSPPPGGPGGPVSARPRGTQDWVSTEKVVSVVTYVLREAGVSP